MIHVRILYLGYLYIYTLYIQYIFIYIYIYRERERERARERKRERERGPEGNSILPDFLAVHVTGVTGKIKMKYASVINSNL